MHDDDPAALEIILKYLYILSGALVKEKQSQLSHKELPEGYLQEMLEIFRLAEKYELGLLAEQTANVLTEPLMCKDCAKMGTDLDTPLSLDSPDPLAVSI